MGVCECSWSPLWPSIQSTWPWSSMTGPFKECKVCRKLLVLLPSIWVPKQFYVLLVQPSSCRCWDMRVTKHPSTLFQGCISPHNVHQRQLWLRGWWCIGGNFIEDWGSFIFPFHGQLEWKHLCSSDLCFPPASGQFGIMWPSILSCLFSVSFLYLWDRGFVYLNPCEFLFISWAFSILDAALEDVALLGFYQGADSYLMLWAGLMLILGFLWMLATAQFCVRVLIIIQASLHPKELPWLCRTVKGM